MRMIIDLRYRLAGWMIDTFYNGGDMRSKRPIIYGIADKLCPHGIPDSW